MRISNTKLLIDSTTKEIAAELIPEEEVKIYNEKILSLIKSCGITVTLEFKKGYMMKGWVVHHDDPKHIVAAAFEKCLFVHGLQQQGYSWRDRTDVDDLTDEEIVEYILSLHRGSN